MTNLWSKYFLFEISGVTTYHPQILCSKRSLFYYCESRGPLRPLFEKLHFVDFIIYKFSEKPVKNGLKGLNFENSLWLRKYFLIRIFPLYFDKFWPFRPLPDFLRPSHHCAGEGSKPNENYYMSLLSKTVLI